MWDWQFTPSIGGTPHRSGLTGASPRQRSWPGIQELNCGSPMLFQSTKKHRQKTHSMLLHCSWLSQFLPYATAFYSVSTLFWQDHWSQPYKNRIYPPNFTVIWQKCIKLLDLSHILPQNLPQILPCFAKIPRLFLFVPDFSMFLSQIVPSNTHPVRKIRPAQLAPPGILRPPRSSTPAGWRSSGAREGADHPKTWSLNRGL